MTEQELKRAQELILEALAILTGRPPPEQLGQPATPPVVRLPPVDMDEETAKKTRFPFGKHKGRTLWDIAEEDRDYLEWAVENLEKMSPKFMAALEKVLELTEDGGEFNGEVNLD